MRISGQDVPLYKPSHQNLDLTRAQVLTNRCRFHCRLCGDDISKWNKNSHLQDKHQTTAEKYFSEFGNTLVNKMHKCLVCRNRICWMRGAIKKHIKSVHKMLLTDYEERFKDQILLQEREETASNGSWEPSIKISKMKTLSQKSEISKNTTSLIETKSFKCDQCESSFSFNSSLNNHMMSEHNLGISSKKSSHKKPGSEWYNRYLIMSSCHFTTF